MQTSLVCFTQYRGESTLVKLCHRIGGVELTDVFTVEVSLGPMFELIFFKGVVNFLLNMITAEKEMIRLI